MTGSKKEKHKSSKVASLLNLAVGVKGRGIAGLMKEKHAITAGNLRLFSYYGVVERGGQDVRVLLPS